MGSRAVWSLGLILSAVLCVGTARAEKNLENNPDGLVLSEVETPRSSGTGVLFRPGTAGELTRYWTLAVREESPVPTVEGRSALRLDFVSQESLCRQHYGDEWYYICYRSTNLTGRRVSGAELSPALNGEWRWEGDYTLLFEPDTPWPADSAYRVSLPAGALPPATQLDARLEFRTLPLRVDGEGAFHVDPLDRSTMAVTGSLKFNYPMDRRSVEARLRFSAGADAGGRKALLGEPVLDWRSEDSELYFSVPVLSLPEGDGVLDVFLEPGAQAISGGKAGQGHGNACGAARNTFPVRSEECGRDSGHHGGSAGCSGAGSGIFSAGGTPGRGALCTGASAATAAQRRG